MERNERVVKLQALFAERFNFEIKKGKLVCKEEIKHDDSLNDHKDKITLEVHDLTRKLYNEDFDGSTLFELHYSFIRNVFRGVFHLFDIR